MILSTGHCTEVGRPYRTIHYASTGHRIVRAHAVVTPCTLSVPDIAQPARRPIGGSPEKLSVLESTDTSRGLP
eukprot:3941296-Rhodomonas_salina.1